MRGTEILPPWYPPFRQNGALNRALGLAASHTLSAPFPCMCPVHPHMSAGRDFFWQFVAAAVPDGRRIEKSKMQSVQNHQRLFWMERAKRKMQEQKRTFVTRLRACGKERGGKNFLTQSRKMA